MQCRPILEALANYWPSRKVLPTSKSRFGPRKVELASFGAKDCRRHTKKEASSEMKAWEGSLISPRMPLHPTRL